MKNDIIEIEKMSLRLKKLRKDIEAGNGQRHKYDRYLSEEERSLELIKKDHYSTFEFTIERVENGLPSVQENIDRILDEHSLL